MHGAIKHWKRLCWSRPPKNWRSVWKRAVTTFRRAKSKPEWNSIFQCLVKLGQGNSGYKIIEEFLPEA